MLSALVLCTWVDGGAQQMPVVFTQFWYLLVKTLVEKAVHCHGAKMMDKSLKHKR